MEDEGVETGIVCTNNDSSDVKSGVQPQSMIVDVDDGNDGTDPVE